MIGTVLKVKKHTIVVSYQNHFLIIKRPHHFVCIGYNINFSEDDILINTLLELLWNAKSILNSATNLMKNKKVYLCLTLDSFTSISMGLTSNGDVAYVEPLNNKAMVFTDRMREWIGYSYEDALEALALAAKEEGIKIEEEKYALTFSPINARNDSKVTFLEKRIINYIKSRYEESNLCISIFKTESLTKSTDISFVRYSIAKSLGKDLYEGEMEEITEKPLKELHTEKCPLEKLPGYIGKVI